MLRNTLFTFLVLLSTTAMSLETPFVDSPIAYSVADEKRQVIYYLERGGRELKRYSMKKHAHLAPVELKETPDDILFEPETRRFFTYYRDDGIYRLKPKKGFNAKEVRLIGQRAQASVSAMTVTPKHIIVRDSLGAWGSFLVYDHDGNLLDSKEWAYPTDKIVWNETNKAFYFVSNYSPRDFHWQLVSDEGLMTTNGESPYHDSTGWSSEFVLSKDGLQAAFSTGRIASTDTGTETAALPSRGITNRLATIWLNNKVVTLDTMEEDSMLRSFDSDFNEAETFTIIGPILGIARLNNSVVLLQQDGCGDLDFVRYAFS